MKCCYPGIIVSVFLIPFLFSCNVTRPSYIFKEVKRDTIIAVAQPNDFLKIKLTDILSISISSISKEEDLLFSASQATTGNSSTAGSGYALDASGYVHLHKLGKIKAEGLTRAELKDTIQKALIPYLRDPMVQVNFANHFVTVMGEVGQSQLLNMPAENISIIDIIAQSGNKSPNALLKDVMVIRDKGTDQKEIKHLNLEDHTIFNSSWYYLQPNDIVVVNPNEKKIINEDKITNYQRTSTFVLQGITVAVLIYNLFFRK